MVAVVPRTTAAFKSVNNQKEFSNLLDIYMKTSNYNIFINSDRGVLVFNALTDSYVFVNDDEAKSLKTREFISSGIFESERIKRFQDAGILVKDDFNELAYLKHVYSKEMHESDVFDLTILPTLDCNVHCWYYFENKNVGSRITPNVKGNILLFIQNIIKDRPYIKEISIDLFGGEPLLHYEEDLDDFLHQIKNVVEGLGKKATFLFITNGLRLTEEVMDRIKDLSPQFQISIDGYKERHDKIKVLSKHADISTYDLVIHNLKNVCKCDHVHVILRLNYDEQTLKNVGKILSDIKDIARSKLSIHFERVWQTKKHIAITNDALIDAWKLFVSHGFQVTYLKFFHTPSSCMSSKQDQVAISYDGKIFKCTGCDFARTEEDGNLMSDGNITWKGNKAEERIQIQTYNHPECLQCKLLPLCWGPYCQKHLLKKEKVMETCQLKSMEMPLESFLLLRYVSCYNQEHDGKKV